MRRQTKKILYVFALMLVTLCIVPTEAIAGSKPPKPSPYEKFTTYTANDPAGNLSITNNCITFTNIETRDTDAYVTKDWTSFQNFDVTFDAKIDSSDVWSGYTVTFGVSDTANATYDDWQNGIYTGFFRDGSNILYKIGEKQNGATNTRDTSVPLSFDTRYYIRITRTGSNIVAQIFTDQQMQNPVDVLQATLTHSDNVQYVYPFGTRTLSAPNRKMTGDVCRMTIQQMADMDAPYLNPAIPGDEEVDLDWTTVAEATGYKVYYGTDSGNLENVVDVGDISSYTVTGLENDVPCYFVVTAYDAQVESGFSNLENATPTAVLDEPTLFISNVVYDDATGQIAQIDYGNGTTEVYTYDSQTLRLIQKVTTNTLGTPLQDFTYTYDSVGNIKTITDNVNTATQSFTYDHLNRLVEATGVQYGTKNYVYSTIGNIEEKDGLTYTYGENGAGPHAVTSLSDGTVLTYDDNGNMISKSASGSLTEYQYDTENRLSAVIKDSNLIAHFAYDGDGGRTEKTIGGVDKTVYVGSLYEEDAVRDTKFVFLGDNRVASMTHHEPLFYHSDHLGGANVMEDKDGVVRELIEYKPFGEFSRRENPGDPHEVAHNYFTGQKLDDETGLYYYGARYYDPVLGRFVTPDLVVPRPGNPQAFNRYSYAGNNPVTYLEDGNGWFIPFIISAVKGAAIGASVGAATAAITGGDIGKGALFGALGGGVFSGVGSLAQSFVRFATVPGGIGPLSSGANFTANTLGILGGGAGAGAAMAAANGSDVGLGALAGLAGATAGFLGAYHLAPSAGHILGNVASAAVTRDDLGRAAYLGFIDSSIGTTIQFMIPEPTIGEQGTPEGGDLIFYRGGLDPSGLFLSYLQGAPITHNAIAQNTTQQIDSHVKGGVRIRNVDFRRRGRIVKWRGTGHKKFIDLAVQYGKENVFKYWLGPGREVCSTFCGRVAAESGLSLPGFSPASQYYNIQNIPYFSAYGVQRP